MYINEKRFMAYNFDFIAVTGDTLWWDGKDKTGLQNVVSPTQAIKWKETHEETVVRETDFLGIHVKMEVPVVSDIIPEHCIDITPELKQYLHGKIVASAIDDYIIRLWIEFMKHWKCVSQFRTITFIPVEYSGTSVADEGMWHLGQFVRGFINTGTVDVKQDKNYVTLPVWEDVPVDFKYRDNKYNFNYYGMYHMRDLNASFRWNYKPLPSGKILQKRQKEAMHEFGRENYIFMSRGGGKTVLCIIIALLLAQCMNTSNRRWLSQTILYFIPEDMVAKQIARNLQEAFRNSENKRFKYTQSNNTGSFYTWRVNEDWTREVQELAQIIFQTSNKQSGELRGGRLLAVFFDEWAAIDESLYSSVVWGLDTDAFIFVLTTIKPWAPKNRAYKNWVRAEIDQTAYEPLEDVLFELYTKYNINQLDKNYLSTPDGLDMLQNMRKDFFRKRPAVCMRYDIDDWEVEEEEDKENKVKAAELKFGREYVLAEFYSTLVASSATFDTSGAIVNPVDMVDENGYQMKFDHIFISYDPGGKSEKGDNAWLSVIWGNEKWLYVLESIGTQISFAKKLELIQQKIDSYSLLLSDRSKKPYFIIETNAADWGTMYSLQKANIQVHFKLRTRWANQKAIIEGSNMSIPAKDLVNNAKFLFNSKFIKISSDCTKDKGLVSEIQNFWLKWGKYQALTGKDDQVFAMLFGLYVAVARFGYAKKIIDYNQELYQDAVSSSYKQPDPTNPLGLSQLSLLTVGKKNKKEHSPIALARRQ